MLVASGHYGGDALNSYFTTESIILDGDLSIYDREFPVREINVDGSQGVTGKDGKKYSPFGIGMPILQIPLFMIGLLISKIFSTFSQGYITFFCVSFTNTILSAINTVLLFILMIHLGFGRRNAVLLSIIYSFSTIAIVYSKTGFSAPALVTFMLVAIISIFVYFGNRRSLFLVISGMALGFMGLIKSYTIILCPIFAVYFLVNEREKKSNIWIPVLSYTVLFSVGLWVNYLRFGGIFRSGYGDAVTVGFTYGNHFIKGLYYYWLSSGKGFFFYSLPLLLGLFSWHTLYSKNRKEFWLVISIILTYTLYFAFFFKRGSIFSWGPRYLFPITPLFILFMGEVFRKKVSVYLLTVMAIGSFLIQLPALMMNYSRYLNFVIEKLGTDEYLINFVPDLNHIKGSWQLLISFFQRHFFHSEYTFVYSPDSMLVKPVSSGMSGYDILDLWFVNLIRINRELQGLSVLCVVVLAGLVIFSYEMLFRRIRRGYDGLEE